MSWQKKNRRGSGVFPASTVLVPCFNAAPFLAGIAGELIDALEKSFSQFEVIFIDDASEDETFSEVARLSESDSIDVAVSDCLPRFRVWGGLPG